MPQVPLALTGVPTADLKKLLRLVHRKEIELPITPVGLDFAAAACFGPARSRPRRGPRALGNRRGVAPRRG